MGFMDELRKLTQPYEDEDDFYEGADPSAQPAVPTEAQMEFESAFGGHEIPEPAEEESETPTSAPAAQEGGKGIFSGLDIPFIQRSFPSFRIWNRRPFRRCSPTH